MLQIEIELGRFSKAVELLSNTMLRANASVITVCLMASTTAGGAFGS